MHQHPQRCLLRNFCFKKKFEEILVHLIHNTPESLCQNTALFIWLGLPSSLIPFQNESNLQTPASRFSLIREHFENRFSITMTSLNHVINPTSQGCTQAFLPLVIVALSNFPGVNVVWTEYIACAFAVPKSLFKISSVQCREGASVFHKTMVQRLCVLPIHEYG